jgi:hypothetical protein
MAARDDFGSNAGTPRGYGGGGYSGRAGGLGNGGVGGGMGGGFAGGGAGRNGGINSRTGLGTGKTMFDGMAMGRPGGPAMNPGAWGVRPQSQVSQGPMNRPTRPGLLGNPTPVSIPGVNPVPEDIPPQTPGGYPQFLSPNLGPLPPPSYTPPSMPIQGPGAVGPTGYWQKNPTGYPQWAGGWKNQTDNYTQGNTYPGGFNYTRELGRDNTWSNDDTRFGIDSMARQRGY